jgi:hypothetical protein
MRKVQLSGRRAACAAALLAAVVLAGCSRAPSGATPDSAATRLKQIEDREQIRRLTMDYGRFLDMRDWDSFSRLFAEKDGEWVGGMGSAKGPQAVKKLMEDTIGKGPGPAASASAHIFTNQVIDLDGDRATALTKWMFVVQGQDKMPKILYLGRYDDTLVRENGLWKFQRRVVHADIPPDNIEPPR